MRGVFMFAVRRFVLWSAFCLLLSTSVLGVFFPHTLREVTASARDLLGMTETVYPYYFIYEDPVMYYSVYRKLLSGTMMIDRTGDVFDINVSVVLPDGKDFSFEYHGQID